MTLIIFEPVWVEIKNRDPFFNPGQPADAEKNLKKRGFGNFLNNFDLFC